MISSKHERYQRIVMDGAYWRSKRKEAMLRRVAYLLPRELVMWCYVRVALHATNGKWGSTVVSNITMMEALKRWDEPNE